MDELTITKPDDWHLHLRDGEHMRAVVADSARRFARAIVMPNLKPPVTTTALALAYRERILEALPGGAGFQPLMTLYLTDNTTRRRSNEPSASGCGVRSQVLSGRGDHQLGLRRDRRAPLRRDLAGDVGRRHAVAGARGSDGSATSTCSTASGCSSSGCSPRWLSGFPASSW